MSSSAEPPQTPWAPQRGDLQDHVDLSTSQSTLSQTLPANIPAQAFHDACDILMANVRPEHDDNRIRRFVWIAVHTALEDHPDLKGRLADKARFHDNVKRKGEQEFFDSVRAMAKSGTWTALFEDSTLFSFFASHHSDHLLCLDLLNVFLTRKENFNTTFVSGTWHLRRSLYNFLIVSDDRNRTRVEPKVQGRCRYCSS